MMNRIGIHEHTDHKNNQNKQDRATSGFHIILDADFIYLLKNRKMNLMLRAKVISILRLNIPLNYDRHDVLCGSV